jgi:hypothetical protein
VAKNRERGDMPEKEEGSDATRSERTSGSSLGRKPIAVPLTVNFGAPNTLVTLWFKLYFETNPSLGTLMI